MPAARASSSSCSRSAPTTGSTRCSKGQIEGIGTRAAARGQGRRGRNARRPDDARAGGRRRRARRRSVARRLAARAHWAARRRSRSATASSMAGPTIAAPVLVDDARARPSSSAGAAGPAPPAEQPGADPVDPRAPPGAAAGRLLRHRLPPRPSRGRRPLTPFPRRSTRGRAPLRLPRPVLRVHRSARCREVAPEIAAGRVVVAHLGNGASHVRHRGGRSVDSTMGFTALDGLPMGTRPGQLDPGVVLYLMARRA